MSSARARIASFAKAALIAALAVVFAGAEQGAGQGTGQGSERSSSRRGAATGPKKRADASVNADSYTGICVPLNATDMLAPEASFRVSGWNSNWGMLKIMQLAKDGQPVKAGEVVARFEFGAKDALQWIEERIARAEADRSQARISAEQIVEGLQVDQRRRKLEADLAAIDIQRERAISKKQASLYRISHQIAVFEAEAIKQRLASALRTRDAEIAYQDENVKRMQQDLGRYTFYEKRFVAIAPHDGVVRHAFNPRERRKFQKGDNVGPGVKLVSVAKDATLAARFFVPEHRIHELREGMTVLVTGATSGEELRAVVKKVDFFPQELGFLMELPSLPNAREKAFAVLAEFEAPPTALTAGTELRVKVSGK